MHKPLSLRKNFFWTFTGNVVKAGSLWGIIALIVKMGNITLAGKFELGRTIAAPVMAITMLQLRAVQVTDAKGEYSFADYLGTRLVMTLLGVVSFVVIAFGWYSSETALIVLLWGIVVSIDSISDIIRGLFQRYECMNLSGISMILKGLLCLAAGWTLMWFTGKLVTAIAGIICAYLLVLCLYDFPNAHRLLVDKSAAGEKPYRLMPRFNFKTMVKLLWLALPLGIVLFLGSLQGSIPKLVLESYHGEEALGFFGPILYPIMSGTLVITAMGQSAAPRLANYYVANFPAYCHLIKKLLLLGLLIGLGLVAFVALLGKPLLTILYAADYAQYHVEFIIMASGGALGFIAVFLGYGLTSARVFKTQLLMALISCSVGIILAFVLVLPYGPRGAAITFASVSATRLICCFAILSWVVHRRAKQINLARLGSEQ